MELLSGPDLGGGFLFQLEVARSDGRAIVTVHAQEGGLEAEVPPKGSLTELGFEPYRGLCPIGGRECFHRGFEVATADLARVRMTYNRSRFVIGPSMDQRHGGAPAPIAEALREFRARLTPAFREHPGGWFVGGTTAAWLHGVEVTPRNIDLGTDRPGVDRIAEALSEYLIEPPATTSWPGGRPVYAARAFVGSLVRGVRVQWAVPSEARGVAPPETEWSFPLERAPTTVLDWEGGPLRVARLEFYLAALARRRDSAGLQAAAVRLAEIGPDLSLLEERESRLGATDGARLRAAVEAARGPRVQA